MERKLRKLRDQAAKHLKRGKHRKALAAYQEIAEAEPENPRWPLKVGELHKKLDEPVKAVNAFQVAARGYAEKGFLLKAIAICNLILAIEPDHEQTQTMLANYYARRRGPRPAMEGVTPPSPRVEVEPRPAPEPQAPAEGPLKRTRTLPPGQSLDSVKLVDIIEEAQPQQPDTTAEGQIFEIPLEEELESAFDEFVVEDDQEQLEQPRRDEPPDKPPPEIPPTPLFSALDRGSLRSLIEKVKVEQYLPGEQIITQGEPGDSLYVIVEGEVAVIREGAPRVEVTRLKEGAFFGEIALLTSFTRTTTVEATAETTVIEISREIVSDLIEEHPRVLKILLRFFRYRLIDTLIETSELFAPFSSEEREKLACLFTFLEADPGTVFIQEGKPSDGLYILLSGQLEVVQGEGAGQLPPLDLGDLFGATSLLGGGKSPFSVRAKSKTWLLKLDRQTFHQVIMTHPQVLAFVADLVERRFKEQAGAAAPIKSSETRLPLI